MKIRTECPRNNKYYIRQVTGGLNGAVAGNPTQRYANVLDNCVGYANGRFNECWNDPELEGIVKPFHAQLVCNAENFIESAKRQGLKISSSPAIGGIMVWQKGRSLSGGDGAGHVAVVERVYDDGTILTSESGWASWAFKTVRRDNGNGRWGQNSNYKFRGCIINPAVKNVITPAPKLTVDGIGGACTARAMQRFFGTPMDGVLSGQNRSCAKYYPAMKAVEFGKGGSVCVKKMQKWIGVEEDGVWGKDTSKALQKKLGVEADGIFGPNSMKAWQKYLNEHDKAVYPRPSVDYYNVIDVSDWQSKIDWNKVKADGVVGAIIRYADGTTLDKRFAENMVNAKAAGLHIGSYIFSRAKTKAEAEAEAERLFNACKPYDLDMPLYIDLEVASLSKYADTVAAAFLNKMAALGARGGVYANLNWWDRYLTKTARDYSSNAFWIAQYNDTMDYKPASRMGMWQYTSSGKVDGINGKVDMDKCYVAYWNTHQKNSKAEEIVAHAKEYAYPEGTKASEYDYPKGSAKPAYVSALKEYMGKTAKISQTDCGYFVSTCVRASGLSSTFLALPAKASNPYPSVPSTMSIVHKGPLDGFALKAGDIIRYRKGKSGQHTVINIGGGRIAHASRKHAFPRISTARPWTNSNVKQSTIQVLRAK